MALVFENIREFCQSRDKKSLELLLITANKEALVQSMSRNITDPSFIEIWNYLLPCFKDSQRDHETRIELVLSVLKEIEEKNVVSSRISTIVWRICPELPKFKSEHLVQICTFCLESIQSGKTIKMGWKDLLPEVLSELTSNNRVFVHNDFDYTGAEYQTEFINSICMTNCSPSIITSLTSVFTEIVMTKEEHLKLVNKLGTYMEKLTPQELPAFVYQLLKLCKEEHGRMIFFRLQHYFGLRLYSKPYFINESSPDTDSFDVIENRSMQDIIESESTILYHIHTAASLGLSKSIKDHLKSMKNMIKSPEIILHPFQLIMLFNIYTVRVYEETVLDIIRPSIVRLYNDERNQQNSCWFREIVPNIVKPEVILSQVVNSCTQEKVVILPALVDFAFALLGIGSGLGRDPIAEKQWILGNIILFKIIKRRDSVAPVIIKTLCNHIITRTSVTQHIECLYILSKKWPLLILENLGCIIKVCDALIYVEQTVAMSLLDVLIPLMKLSSTIRDHLVLMLRKALYNKSIETKQVAVTGFLKMMAHLKLSNLTSFSQNSSSSFNSGHSIYTQISLSMSNHAQNSQTSFSNEALCFEILTMLRRCFMQQADVRMLVYDGLCDAIIMNPELGIPILDFLWFHFIDYYNRRDKESLPPLYFEKITSVRGAEAILMEPVGKLVYVSGLIVTKLSENENNRENNAVINFTNALDSLCERMKNCELVHFNLDDGTDLLDIVPESQSKMYVLKEAMSVYEALIGYKIYSWTKESENHGKMVYDLFLGYERLNQFFKCLSKPKKADGKRKKNDKNKSTQQTQNATTTNANKGTKNIKNIKPPETVFDLKVITKALSLLHEPKLDWTDSKEANVVKSKQEIHRHFMNATIFLINKVKKHKSPDSQINKIYYDHLVEVARILFNRIVKRLHEFLDFDCTTGILATECFHLILTVVISNYKSNFSTFLQHIVDSDEDGLVPRLKVLIDTYQNLFEMDEDLLSEDIEIKKLSIILINTLVTLANQIPNDGNILSSQLCDWLKTVAHDNTISPKVSIPFINLFFNANVKYKASLTLLENISLSIGRTVGVITEEEQTVKQEEYKIIHEGTVSNIILSLCNTVKSILDNIDSIVGRLKSDYNILTYPGIDNVEKHKESLKNKELGVCCHLCFVVSVLTNLSNLFIQSGNLSEAIFSNLIRLYNVLTSFTKHFIVSSSTANLSFENARFERLVKLVGKQLTPTVYKFITHIDDIQNQELKETEQKKKNTNRDQLKRKLLKETRFIPKVVNEIEIFSKHVTQLSKNTKVELMKYLGQGIARDFRIMDLRKVLEEAGGMEDIDMDDSIQDEETRNDEGESIPDTSSNQRDDDDDDDNEDDSIESSPPPSKRSKK